MGIHVADLYFSLSSYSFGSARSCLSFQNLTSVVVLLARALGGEIFNEDNCIITNYLDDIIIFARSMAWCRKAFKVLVEVMKFLGFKLSKSKQLAPCSTGVVLGLEFQLIKRAVACTPERAKNIVDAMYDFQKDILEEK